MTPRFEPVMLATSHSPEDVSLVQSEYSPYKIAMKIKIVGAGIGGLTLAAALTKYCIDFEIHEAAGDLRATGYGLILQRNALSALD